MLFSGVGLWDAFVQDPERDRLALIYRNRLDLPSDTVSLCMLM